MQQLTDDKGEKPSLKEILERRDYSRDPASFFNAKCTSSLMQAATFGWQGS